MSKCMYQECNNEATKIIPCFIGPQNTKECIHVCNYHWFVLTKSQPVSVSFEMHKDKMEERNKEKLNEYCRIR